MTPPPSSVTSQNVLLFPQYRPSDRAVRGHVLATARMGLLPLLVASALIYARHFAAGPGLWAGLGITLGLHLILRGARGLTMPRDDLSRVGARLAASSDRWFPVFLFAIQTAFAFVSFALLGLTIKELGFPTAVWQDAVLTLIVLLIPACRLAREAMKSDDSPRLELVERFLRYLCVVLGTTWLVSFLILLLAPPGEKLLDEYVPVVIVLWVIDAVVILACVALYADHALRIRKETPTG